MRDLSRFCADFWFVAYHTNTRKGRFSAVFSRIPGVSRLCVVSAGLARGSGRKRACHPHFDSAGYLTNGSGIISLSVFPFSRTHFPHFFSVIFFFFWNLASSVFATLWALSSSFFTTTLSPLLRGVTSFCFLLRPFVTSFFLSVLWRYFRSFGSNNKLAPLVKL